MDTNNYHAQNRDISSSNDRCKCTLCINQQEHQMTNKKPLSNIHIYHHLKKRQGPPIKKEANKDSSFKPKIANKQLAATPAKHKVDRSKEAYLALVAQQYHMVSHSQRLKEDNEQRRDERLRNHIKNNAQMVRLAQINENLENSRFSNKNNANEGRGRVDASPHCSKPSKSGQKSELK